MMINQDYIDEVEKIDRDISNKSRQISMRNLLDFKKGKISIDEFNRECAYIFLEYINDVKPEYVGSEPKDLEEYHQLDKKEQRDIRESFWRQPQIYNFLEHKQKVICWNVGQVQNLIKFLGYIPKEDIDSRQKFRDKILEFRGSEGVDIEETAGKIKITILKRA